MITNQIVKTPSLFTLILAFLAIGMNANASVMDKEKGKNKGKTEKVVEPATTVVFSAWYFNGSVSNDPTDPDNYTSTPPSTPCDQLPEQICEISAPASGGKPDMAAPVPGTSGQTVLSQIQDAHDSLNNEDREPTLNETVQAFRSL